jgi:hypothetical protein
MKRSVRVLFRGFGLFVIWALLMVAVSWLIWIINPGSGSYDMPTLRGILSRAIPIGICVSIGSWQGDYFNRTGKYPFYFLFPKSRERVLQRAREIEKEQLQRERSPIA